MQWDTSIDSGFSNSPTTWLPLAADYKTKNVEAEEAEPDSLLNWHKQLIELRRKNPAMRGGSMVMLDETNPSVLSFVRKGASGKPSVIVAINCTAQAQTVSLDTHTAGVAGGSVTTLLTDAPSLKSASSLNNLTLPPFSSWVGSIK